MKLNPLMWSVAAGVVLSACAGMPATPSFDQTALPEVVKVPAGHKIVMETVGAGQIAYQCRAKANTTDAFEWVFVGPDAVLRDRSGQAVGKYYGPPATWESKDGSKITGTQLAVSPAAAGNIPLQLVKANPAVGQGAMTGVSHVQRVKTVGGVAPSSPCTAAQVNQREIVGYQADYIFWAPM